MKRRSFVGTLGAGLAGVFLPALQPLPRLKRERFVERWSWAMGQAVHVMVYAESEDLALEACANALMSLRALEARLTLFDDASELCELNRHAGKRPLRVSEEMAWAVGWSDWYRRYTRGAFNAAVEPLMRVWGFHHSRTTMPSATELAAARKSVATAAVRQGGKTVSLPNSHTRLDFGGIGVGLGIDLMRRTLGNAGIRQAFIDISGDCFGLGSPPHEPAGWPVRIAGSTEVIRLRDQALATSSNLMSVVNLQGRVVGHVMDPERGIPVETRRQATVVAMSATEADALSTASLVTGEPYRSALGRTYFTE